MEATLQRGDAVLYKAKGAGGNRVIADAAERRRMPRLRKVDLTMAVSDNHAIPGHTMSPIGQLRMHLFYMTAINPNPDTEVDAEIASVLNSRPAILARASVPSWPQAPRPTKRPSCSAARQSASTVSPRSRWRRSPLSDATAAMSLVRKRGKAAESRKSGCLRRPRLFCTAGRGLRGR